MDYFDISVEENRLTKFAQSFLRIENEDTCGVTNNKNYGWIAKLQQIYIVSLKNGQIVSFFEFLKIKDYEISRIRKVEYFCYNSNQHLLAVVVDVANFPSRNLILVLSIHSSSVIKCIEVNSTVNAIQFLDKIECRRSLLQYFNGGLALGCEDGSVLLLDLQLTDVLTQNSSKISVTTCAIYDYNTSLANIRKQFIKCVQSEVHMILKMQSIDGSCPVSSLNCISLILGLCVGYDDGRLAVFDLLEMQLLCTVEPVHGVIPLMKLISIEPRDDPRPCIYVWAIHQNREVLTTVLHALMYETRIEDCTGNQTFENFQICCVRNHLILEEASVQLLACQPIISMYRRDEEDVSSLCGLSWFSKKEQLNKLLIFDLNQWYKEEMPMERSQRVKDNYIATYIMKGSQKSFYSHIQANTVTNFNSMERCEEHFYPNSISFECALFCTDGIRFYIWEGAQNKLINVFRFKKSEILYDPSIFFNEIIDGGLTPTLIEINGIKNFSKKFMQEVLLSFALENNCLEILRDCTKYCFDNNNCLSYNGSAIISLDFLIEWSWKRATAFKTRCNSLCSGFFKAYSYGLDNRAQKELEFLTRQLKLLVEFLGNLNNILKDSDRDLFKKYNSLRIGTEYLEVLLWMLGNGLLPGSLFQQNSSTSDIPQQPFLNMNIFYAKKRKYFYNINEQLILKKSGSCRLIFVDKFINRECNEKTLQELWEKNGSDGIYPPLSLEALLRTMLVSDTDFESKTVIIMYFLLDLQWLLVDTKSTHNLISNLHNFTKTFKLQPDLLKTIVCFWNLDHGNFLSAVEVFMSLYTNKHSIPQWYNELFIEVLLMQNAPKLALRCLDVCSAISPVLKLKALLVNDVLNEAFHFARSKTANESLLVVFFKWCVSAGKYCVLRELSLSERETFLLQNIIKQSKFENSDTLYLAFLLQKSKYVEAISFMNVLSKCNELSEFDCYASERNSCLLTSAFNYTVSPITQGLTDVYFQIRKKLKKNESSHTFSKPFSCQLNKINLNNLSSGIYESSVLSSNFASYWIGEEVTNETRRDENMCSLQNAPFLRKPQNTESSMFTSYKGEISYPSLYKACEKRPLTEGKSPFSVRSLNANCYEELNPTKRRRYLSGDVSWNIIDGGRPMNTTHLRNKNSNDKNLTNESFFTCPLTSCDQNVKQKEDNSKQLHGILKVNLSSQKELVSRPLVEEDKNIRFHISKLGQSNEDFDLHSCNNAETDFVSTPVEEGATSTKWTSCLSSNVESSCDSSTRLFENQYKSKIDNSSQEKIENSLDENNETNATIEETVGNKSEKIESNYNRPTKPFATSTTYDGVCSFKTVHAEDKILSHSTIKDVNNKSLKKLNECTTVVGNFTEIEITNDSFKSFQNHETSAQIEQIDQAQHIDTTLSMTSYDLTAIGSQCLLNTDVQNSLESPKTESKSKMTLLNLDVHNFVDNELCKSKSTNEAIGNASCAKKELPKSPEVQIETPVHESYESNNNLSSNLQEQISKSLHNIEKESHSLLMPENNSSILPMSAYDSDNISSVADNDASENFKSNENKNCLEEIKTIKPQKSKSNRDRGVSEPPVAITVNSKGKRRSSITRATSVPPNEIAVDKNHSRHVLGPISEDMLLDSPSARTRSRTRLNSLEKILDDPLTQSDAQSTRKRRTSTSSKKEKKVSNVDSKNKLSTKNRIASLRGKSEEKQRSSPIRREISEEIDNNSGVDSETESAATPIGVTNRRVTRSVLRRMSLSEE